ncbi:MAG: hypothetical protein M3Q19_03855 [Pseudomonadota bacterium]|nr:hypothetical protein [Pseudomonadota bacterium]
MIFSTIWQMLKKLFGQNKGVATMSTVKKPDLVDIDVNVTWANPADPCSVSFSLEPKNGNKVKVGKNAKGKDFAKFENKGDPGFIIFFNIVEKNGSGCQFLPDPDDAMWVQPSAFADPPCPSSPAYWSQFRAIDVVDHDSVNRNKTLIVLNQNDYQQSFAFTLRFEVAGCNKILEFDPIGDNQNGNQFS